MDQIISKKFSFISNSLPPDTFGVVSFSGAERISTPYKFEITLISENLKIDFKAIMNSMAKLVFHREEGKDVFYHGIVANFEQLQDVGGYAIYRTYLVPRLWWLSVIQHNQVFLNKTIEEFMKEILNDGDLTDLDYEFRLQGSYEPVEYVCQYGETHLNFLSHWCERKGIYYYFEQAEDREKIIFTDTKVAHKESGDVVYSPPSGLQAFHLDEAVSSFHCRQNALPAKVLVKDYNYRKPSLEIEGAADVDENGRGTVYFYHEHFRTREEGDKLAKIRAEGIICRSDEYYGTSSVNTMLSGYTFNLAGHYRDDFNRKYLAVEVIHEGDQTDLLPQGIIPDPDAKRHRMHYVNRFTAIPATAQFRPQITTKKPTISGSIVARIDASGSGQYAELDEMGRYKVVMPFDISGKHEGKASSWIRMAQPYGGSDHGMHFPLHKGTEVLLTFVNGDPDRPIITAAVPNPSMPSLVTSANQTSNIIHTSGGNKIHMEDHEGRQHIILHSPAADSTICMGSAQAPEANENAQQEEGLSGSWKKNTDFDAWEGIGIHLATSKWLDIKAQFVNQLILGGSNTIIIGEAVSIIGAKININLGLYSNITLGVKQEWQPARLQYIGTNKATTLNEIKATELETKIAGQVNKVIGQENLAANEQKQVINNSLYTAANRSEIIQEGKNISQDKVEITKELKALIQKEINVVNDQISNIGKRIESVEDDIEFVTLKLLEAKNQIETVSTKISQSDTNIQQSNFSSHDHKITTFN